MTEKRKASLWYPKDMRILSKNRAFISVCPLISGEGAADENPESSYRKDVELNCIVHFLICVNAFIFLTNANPIFSVQIG